MITDVVRFQPEDDVEAAAQAFERYDLVTAVVDGEKQLIGRSPSAKSWTSSARSPTPTCSTWRVCGKRRHCSRRCGIP